MIRRIIINFAPAFHYYLKSVIMGDFYEVSEVEFFSVVGYDRDVVKMEYEPGNINRQIFCLNNEVIAYRQRGV